jgi:hypothetical protein
MNKFDHIFMPNMLHFVNLYGTIDNRLRVRATVFLLNEEGREKYPAEYRQTLQIPPVYLGNDQRLYATGNFLF